MLFGCCQVDLFFLVEGATKKQTFMFCNEVKNAILNVYLYLSMKINGFSCTKQWKNQVNVQC